MLSSYKTYLISLTFPWAKMSACTQTIKKLFKFCFKYKLYKAKSSGSLKSSRLNNLESKKSPHCCGRKNTCTIMSGRKRVVGPSDSWQARKYTVLTRFFCLSPGAGRGLCGVVICCKTLHFSYSEIGSVTRSLSALQWLLSAPLCFCLWISFCSTPSRICLIESELNKCCVRREKKRKHHCVTLLFVQKQNTLARIQPMLAVVEDSIDAHTKVLGLNFGWETDLWNQL